MSSRPDIRNVSVNEVKPSAPAVPAWRLVLNKELADLWIRGRALLLLLAYSILLGIMAHIYSVDILLNLLPPREAFYEILKNAMAVSTFVGLIIGADSLSGERDRATLESLLLTPIRRRHVIVAKLLAGLSVWPVAYVIAVPYLSVLATGDRVFASALLWGAITGTMLVLGYTGIGMLISFWSSSNRVSYFVSLGIYALLLLPTELPGDAVEPAGQILQWVNPIAAANHFLANHIVDYQSAAQFWTWLISPAALAVLSIGSLLTYASSTLRLEAGGASNKFWVRLRNAISLAILPGLLIVFALASPVYALERGEGLTITIDKEYHKLGMGNQVELNMMVTNNTSEASPPLIVAMNIINLDKDGEAVDPEDWSPERTQYIDPLAASESTKLAWTINPILEGDFMVYMVLVPEPAGAETTSQPVASSGMHLTVTPFTQSTTISVLPLAIGEPILLLAITYFVYRHRRQQLDLGGSS